MSTLTGNERLKKAVEKDMKDSNDPQRYQEKYDWIIARAKHYAEKTGLTFEEIINAWENDRNYWYMNYYQEANQPEIKSDNVRVFDTVKDMLASIGEAKFRCPNCRGISTNPYSCNSGIEVSKGKVCDWKVYGLFGDLGKGANVFVKEKIRIENIFMPVTWEEGER